MRIFGLGLPELVVILIIICVLCGPALFKKLGGRAKKVGKAAVKGIETGATNAGVDVDKIKEENKGKTVAERIETFQDKVDEKLESKKDIDFGDGDEDAKEKVEA